MRTCITVVIAGCLLTAHSGCGLLQMGKDMASASVRLFTPKSHDYFDPANNDEDFASDEWASVGQEGRGDTAREKESDWFSQFESPKTRAINRNLGFD